MVTKRSSKSTKKADARPSGKNGKKEGLSGSSFFTWFMVIALLGVWTSVAVVWFDLVDYEDVLAKAKDFRYNLSEVLQGKLGVYDADGDGDFDVDDAKVLLGLTKDGSSVNIDSLEEVLNILAEESSDWFYGFLSFLYDVMTPFEMVEEEEGAETDDVDDVTGGTAKPKTKAEGLKERTVVQQPSDESDSPAFDKSGLSDADLKDVLIDSQESVYEYDDVNDLEDALDEYETLQSQDDDINDFDLEDALEPSVHESLPSEYDDFDLEDALEPSVHESLTSEYEAKDEPEEQAFVEDSEPKLEQEPAAAEDDKVADPTLEDEPETVQEPEAEAEVLETPNTEVEDEPAEVEEVEIEAEPLADEEEEEEIPALVADEEPEAAEEPEEQVAAGEQEPQEDHNESDHETEVSENQEEYETYEESLMTEDEAAIPEPAEHEIVSDDQENEYTEEDEPAEFLDVPEAEGEYVPEQTEEPAPETLEPESTDDPVEETEALNFDDNEEYANDTPLDEEPSEPEEETLPPPEEEQIEEDEQLEVEQNEATENPVEDDRPHEKAVEPNTVTAEEQNEEHADESLSQEKMEKAKKKKPKLLNKFDKTIKAELDAAEKLRKKGKGDEALKAFENLVTKYPQSPRARYGKAQSEDDLAEKLRSNDILLRAISSYEEVSALPNVPTDLVKLALQRRADRQQFLGRMRGSVLTLQKLVQLYPEDISLKNDLGVGYLMLGDNKKAQQVYEEVLSLDPNNGFAKVHYGFILKADNKIAESIPYLKEGLLSDEPGTDDGRFYFHLGDALQRVGDKEAYTWYEVGYKKGHFASVWQRSLYNVDGLKAQPWWTAKETGYTDLVRTLEANWKIIRDEGLSVMDDAKGLFIPEDENLREKGDWSQYTLWQQGRMNEKSCKAAPRTCGFLERFPESIGCRRGQIKYSVMHPGTHVWPHTGPTNCRLRMHLGLVIPSHGCKIRCANDTRTWEEGKVLIFDDSFEHEVWQQADSYRLIFIVDVWHPELTQHQRRTLSAI